MSGYEEEQRKEEHLLLWNSKAKINKSDNNCYCAVTYRNHHWLANTIKFKVKSITLTNLFPNVYAGFTNLYTWGTATPTVSDTLTIPKGNYKTTAELDAVVQALLETAYGATVTVLTDANGYMTISTTGNSFHIMTPSEVLTRMGSRVTCSLNDIIGLTNDPAFTSVSTPYTMIAPVNLAGVRRVRIGSSTAASSHSVHSNGDNGDIIASISMDKVEYGAVVSYEWESSENAYCHFRESRDCVSVDIHVVDEHDQLLELPGNADIDIEFMVASRTP